MVGFLPADDERMRATVAVLERELGCPGSGGLLRRWSGAPDGAFGLCSFWLAENLARAGEVDRARGVFEAAAGAGTDLGLLAEEVGPDTGAPLGNLPQAFSHVGLVNAAYRIGQAQRRWPGYGRADRGTPQSVTEGTT